MTGAFSPGHLVILHDVPFEMVSSEVRLLTCRTPAVDPPSRYNGPDIIEGSAPLRDNHLTNTRYDTLSLPRASSPWRRLSQSRQPARGDRPQPGASSPIRAAWITEAVAEIERHQLEADERELGARDP